MKLVQVSETFVVGFGTRNPLCYCLFIEEVACANNLQYKGHGAKEKQKNCILTT